MVIFRLWYFFIIVTSFILETSAVTHWVVTENGKIESFMSSPFNMRRPYDLIALLEQETRFNDINMIYQNLITRKSTIDQKLLKVKDISNVGTLDEFECLTKTKSMADVDFYANIATNGSNWKDVEIDLSLDEESTISVYQLPDCSKYSKLEEGSLEYDKLSVIKNRDDINISPEVLLEKLLPVASTKLFGHEVAQTLLKNSTSWIHYNLATLYWRIKGIGVKAIECSRRALHHVPFQYKDIPLHTMAGIFHQARHSRDAISLLLEALEISPDQPAHYLALGNVYAALAEYNMSVVYYDKFLNLKTDQDVIAAKHAAMCFWKVETDLWKLENNLVQLQKSFQSMLTDLHDYHEQQKDWMQLQERLVWEQASTEIQGIGSILRTLDKKCLKKIADNPNTFVTCETQDLTVIDSFDLQTLFSFVESQTQQIDEQLAKGKLKNYRCSDTINEKIKAPLLKKSDEINTNLRVAPKIPNKSQSGNFGEFYFDKSHFPSKEECKKWDLPINDKEDLNFPIFLPPETKGYRIKSILSHLIDVPEDTEHKLPWYPPVCEDLEQYEEKLVAEFDKYSSNAKVKTSDYLRNHLLNYVNGGKAEEAEIGQRIITAMEKKVAPTWVLATVASLYWRVRNNHKKALSCLDLALSDIQEHESLEIIFTSIASLADEMGIKNLALKYAKQALQNNQDDPSANFLLALINYKGNEPLIALHHLKSTLRSDLGYYEGKAEYLLKLWSCKLKIGLVDVNNGFGEKHMDKICSEKGSFNGEGVVCSANGEHCKTASVQCYRTDAVPNDDNVDVDLDLGPPIISSSCGKHKPEGSVLTSLLSETSFSDTDKLILNGANGIPHQAFHMRISLGESHASTVSVALTDDPVPEALLQLYDKSGTLLLSPQRCKDIRDAEWVHFTSMWQSLATRNVDIGSLLKPLSKPIREDMKPYCSRATSVSSVDHLTSGVLKSRLPNSPEKSLSEWLGLMASDQKASVKELGAKISIALKENSTSWILANAAALYWRIVGNTEEAVICLRQALKYVSNNMRDVPLISLANVLNRVGFYNDALEASYMALKSHPNYVFNHFTAGNIHTAMGDFEKAISFYRSSLTLDANFAPARNRLLAISCTLLYDESGSLRDGSPPGSL